MPDTKNTLRSHDLRLRMEIPADAIRVVDASGVEIPLRDLDYDQLEDFAGAFLEVLLSEQRRERMH